MVRYYLFSILIAFLFFYCERKTENISRLQTVDYWNSQTLRDIIPSQTELPRDKKSGAFYTIFDSFRQPSGNQNKYSSMISKHLFSYSVSYLLSGNVDYLAIVVNTIKWLVKNAWDNQYGGWFDVVDVEGNPAQMNINTITQFCTVTGLVRYYFVAHDKTILVIH